MSYTLRGRVESRLAAGLLALLVAAVVAALVRSWWPLEVAALMLAVGLALDLAVYHPLLPYQPGWAAVPMGLVELGLTMLFARPLGLGAPLAGAVALFATAWALAQVLGHAALPLTVLTYAEDGGELGRVGRLAAGGVAVVLAVAGGVAWTTRPPTVHLEAGVHRGPLVLDHAQTLIGEPGAIVRGSIRITADDVTVRDVTVLAGDDGIVVHHADDVVLERVTVTGADLDGVQVRRGQVTIRDCRVTSGREAFAQGIDISFSLDVGPSTVEGCTVTGGQEGIVSHSAEVMVTGNRVAGTRMRGIAITEMSMGMAERNEVGPARGVGLFCGDYSMCEFTENIAHGIRPDSSGDGMRAGFGLVSHFNARATVDDNVFTGNGGAMRAFAGARIRHED